MSALHHGRQLKLIVDDRNDNAGIDDLDMKYNVCKLTRRAIQEQNGTTTCMACQVG